MESFMKRVSKIQSEVKAPKNQLNKFGGFNYRSCEDILEAAKPICSKYDTLIILSDKVNFIGTHFYIESTATLYDLESDAKIESTASAREAEQKRGMDESQISGSASSYARKYALSGLLGLDDTRDIDGDKPEEKKSKEEDKKSKKTPAKKEPEHFKCPECGKEFTPYTDKNGTIWMPEQQYEAAKKRNPDGIPRCASCRKKHGI